MAQHVTVMVSSTIVDLPKHREEVKDACWRQGMYPLMMEHQPASCTDPIKFSLGLVDQADVYVGVYAHRYGYVPPGHEISLTEMEYDRAVERGIPRLIFVMDKDHPIKIRDVDVGEAGEKLKKFKTRIGPQNFENFFKSPDDLGGHVINSLSRYRQSDLTAFDRVAIRPGVSDIPTPPEAYIAHPYTLLQSKVLVGRQAELNRLTDWVAKPGAEVYQAHILSVVAIGGMGKSALTWKWFNDIAPQEMKSLAGRMWWSFYESDASFENFITRALAYVTRRPREEVEKILPPDRESRLLVALDREPYLIVLDGLERILIAYAGMDGPYLSDDGLDRQTGNFVAGAIGLGEGAAQSFLGQHRLRKTADPRAGAFLRKAGTFLRKAASVHASRILVSTRLYPADLQTAIGDPIPGSFALFLRGLADDDALGLWRKFGVTGSRDELLALFRSFEKHPLLIQALASEVANDRRAPRDFDEWRKAHSNFNPFRLPLVQAKSQILEFALRGLEPAARKVLQTIAAFRMPVNYDTLAALMVRSASEPSGKQVVLETLNGLVGQAEVVEFADETALDKTLTALEDRGLLGWDKGANRYDLHPIVRGVVWSELDDGARRSIYGVLERHFRSLPAVDQKNVDRLEDLTSAIELYNTLIGLGLYKEACDLFSESLDKPTLYRLSASRHRAVWLQMLFPDGLNQLPRLETQDDQAFTLNALAMSYQTSGQPGCAVPLYRSHNAIRKEQHRPRYLVAGLGNLSEALRLSGALRESESAARRALSISRELQAALVEGNSLLWLGMTLAVRGAASEAKTSLQNASIIFRAQAHKQREGVVSAYLAYRVLLLGDAAATRTFANSAWQLAAVEQGERDFIRAARLQGAAALALGDLPTADERLLHALSRARAVNFVEEELPALAALAALRREQGDMKAARDLLDDVWELAERGPYPLDHADALNVLAQVERDAGNRDAAAVEAATKAYRLAWCDGPPFAYHWGLEAARAHLKALKAPESTDLPPYDESKYEPMPEIEINAPDEVGTAADGAPKQA